MKINEFRDILLFNIGEQWDKHIINTKEANLLTEFVNYVVVNELQTLLKVIKMDLLGIGDEDLKDDRGNNNER